MRAEIISVGTELLLGNVVNTDAADISRMLSELGIDVSTTPSWAITARGRKPPSR